MNVIINYKIKLSHRLKTFKLFRTTCENNNETTIETWCQFHKLTNFDISLRLGPILVNLYNINKKEKLPRVNTPNSPLHWITPSSSLIPDQPLIFVNSRRSIIHVLTSFTNKGTALVAALQWTNRDTTSWVSTAIVFIRANPPLGTVWHVTG